MVMPNGILIKTGVLLGRRKLLGTEFESRIAPGSNFYYGFVGYNVCG